MQLTPEQCAVIQARLDGAEDAYDKLMRGKSVRVLVDQNGERIEFTPATLPNLRVYIAELNQKLLAGGCGGCTVSPFATSPLEFYFK